MKKTYKLFTILIVAVLSLTACKNNFIDDYSYEKKDTNDTNIAYLSFGINERLDRKAVPAALTWDAVNSIELTANGSTLKTWISSAEENAYAQMKSDNTIVLNVGTYNFTVYLKDLDGDILQTGKLENVEIASGENPLHFTTKAYLTGTGKFTLNCSVGNCPRDVSSVKYRINNNNAYDNKFNETFEFGNGKKTHTFVIDEVPCGIYSLVVKFMFDGSDEYEAINDFVEIQNKRDTIYNCKYESGSMNCPVEYWNELPDGSHVKAEFIQGFEPSSYMIGETLPSAEKIIKPAECEDLEFYGWYYKKGADYVEVTELTEPSSTKITLCARWAKRFVGTEDFDEYLSNYFLVKPTDETFEQIPDIIRNLDSLKKIKVDLSNLDITEISESLFSGCFSMEEIILPDNLTTIGSYAFQGCTSLAEITIPESVTTIGDYAFYVCTSLTEITIPKSVEEIDTTAFYDCNNLKKVTIHINQIDAFEYQLRNSECYCTVIVDEEITAIDDNAFMGFEGLKTIVIAENSQLETIGNNVFQGCTSLAEITIPESVTTIGVYAFSECTSLTEITIPESVTTIGDYAFYVCTSLTEITIPKSVEEIDTTAFYDCNNLKKVTIHINQIDAFEYQLMNSECYCTVIVDEEITAIDDNAFMGFEGLKTIVIAENSQLETIGNNVFQGCTSLAEITIPESVTTIGSSAFQECMSLAEITIPESVTTIGGYAFQGCTSLAEITIPESVTTIGGYAFSECTSLTEITIPESVTTIGGYAFQGCTSLAEITIPESVTTIGGYAFQGCTSLAEITIPESVTTIGGYAFSECTSLTEITIPEGVTTIGDNAFQGCTSLTEITIPKSVEEIDTTAFYYCNNLKKVTIHINQIDVFDYQLWNPEYCCKVIVDEEITAIVDNAFMGFKGLKTIVIAENSQLETIGNSAFQGCTSLAEITIPESVTTIGSFAFQGCTSFAEITIPESVTTIGDYAFSECTSLTEITIPESVTTIGDNAFQGCTSLAEITIPESVTTIGGYAFQGCTSLAEITIPESVTTIRGYAFSECTSLTEITIPESVTTIGDYAFHGCTSLTEITIPKSVEEIDTTAFYDCNNLKKVTIHINQIDAFEYQLRNSECYCTVIVDEEITAIDDNAFMGFEGLKTIVIAENSQLETIGSYAFQGCTSLAEIQIPSSVKIIGNNAFQGCTLFAEITIPESVTTIGSYAFQRCTSLAEITIPESVTTIRGYAFSECTSLTEITIPQSVEEIDTTAFYDCNNLKKVTIHINQIDAFEYQLRNSECYCTVIVDEEITAIDDNAFMGFEGLKTIVIAENSQLETIGNNAFKGCTSLEEIQIPSSVEKRIQTILWTYIINSNRDNF